MRRVLLHCNAGSDYGMGHLMRSLALAEQAKALGWEVMVGGDLSGQALDVLQSAIPDLEAEQVPAGSLPTWLPSTVKRLQPDVVHLDSYWVPHDAVVAGGDYLLSNMQDGVFGVRAADVAIDANLGAERRFQRPELSRWQLAGTAVSLIRNDVTRRRGEWHPSDPTGTRHVLVVMGGTDPHRLTAQVVQALASSRVPLALTVVAPPEQASEIRDGVRGTHHRVSLLRFIKDLPAVAQRHDLVVSAAGTSIWDFACMGLPLALVCAVENQLPGYLAVVNAGLALPLGIAGRDDFTEAVPLIADALLDPARLGAWSDRLRSTTDGHGAWRVVTAWDGLTHATVHSLAPKHYVFRPAQNEDLISLSNWMRLREVPGPEPHVETPTWFESLSPTEDRCRLAVFEDEGRILGAVSVRTDGPTAEAWVLIEPEHRSPEVAVSVLRCVESAFEADDAHVLIARLPAGAYMTQPTVARAGYFPYLPTDAAGTAVVVRFRVTRGPSVLSGPEIAAP